MQKSTLKTSRNRNTKKGIVHILATYNNTLVSISTFQGSVLSSKSCGTCGFSGARKKTPFAARTTASVAAKDCFEQGIREALVYVSGPGQGRETAIRRIREAGIHICLIRDITALPHNGCRPPGKRRV
jgi:small subunit ribosomal protein S11